MDGVVPPGVNRRSIPAVLIDDQSKIYALINQSFLAMNSSRVGSIDARSFVPSNNVKKERSRAISGIPLDAVTMVTRSWYTRTAWGVC